MGENLMEAGPVNHLYLNRDDEKWTESFIQELSSSFVMLEVEQTQREPCFY
jgi:hypothetical protein